LGSSDIDPRPGVAGAFEAGELLVRAWADKSGVANKAAAEQNRINFPKGGTLIRMSPFFIESANHSVLTHNFACKII
jgi:hypothetical protein